jgi:hypothetical protein
MLPPTGVAKTKQIVVPITQSAAPARSTRSSRGRPRPRATIPSAPGQ